MSGVPSLNMEEERKSDTSVSNETVALQQMVRDLMDTPVCVGCYLDSQGE